MELLEEDYLSFADTVCQALNSYKLTKGFIEEVYEKIPEDLKLDIRKYGSSDSPTRENVYLWVELNIEN